MDKEEEIGGSYDKNILGFLLWPFKKFFDWLASGLPKGKKWLNNGVKNVIKCATV